MSAEVGGSSGMRGTKKSAAVALATPLLVILKDMLRFAQSEARRGVEGCKEDLKAASEVMFSRVIFYKRARARVCEAVPFGGRTEAGQRLSGWRRKRGERRNRERLCTIRPRARWSDELCGKMWKVKASSGNGGGVG